MTATEDLFLACTIGNLQWIKSCIEQEGINPLVALSKDGMNCLQLVSLNAHPNSIEYILTFGLSPRSVVEDTKENCFHLVVGRKHNYHKGVKSLQLLISALKSSVITSTLNQLDAQGQTPLHKATVTGNISNIKLLLKNGARSDIRDKSGYLPIDIAKSHSNYEAARLLKSHLWSLEKNKRQHYMLINKNKELMEAQQDARTQLAKRREMSEIAYLEWVANKKAPFNITQSKLYPHFGPTNINFKNLTKTFNNSMNKEIFISFKQEKRNLDIFKHTQHLPAPLVIRSATPKYFKKVWIPQNATQSAAASRFSQDDISNELCDRFTNPNTLHSLTGSELKIECYEELSPRTKSRNSNEEQVRKTCISIDTTQLKPISPKTGLNINIRQLKMSLIPNPYHDKSPIPIQQFEFPVSNH